MKTKLIRNIRAGDQVKWTDPDGGICSKTLTISSIKIEGDIVKILDDNGDYLECFSEELS